MGQTNEARVFTLAKADACILFDNGVAVQGKITWTDDYTVGFVPDLVAYAPGADWGTVKSEDVLARLGMTRGRESLVFKGFIRVVTPMGEEHGRQADGRSKNPSQRLQPVAATNRQRR